MRDVGEVIHDSRLRARPVTGTRGPEGLVNIGEMDKASRKSTEQRRNKENQQEKRSRAGHPQIRK